MSLTYGKYYADPSNKFGDILFIACGEKIDKTDQGKKQLLEKYHIALWDILYSAVRKTSNDKDISYETPNNLPLFIELRVLSCLFGDQYAKGCPVSGHSFVLYCMLSYDEK